MDILIPIILFYAVLIIAIKIVNKKSEQPRRRKQKNSENQLSTLSAIMLSIIVLTISVIIVSCFDDDNEKARENLLTAAAIIIPVAVIVIVVDSVYYKNNTYRRSPLQFLVDKIMKSEPKGGFFRKKNYRPFYYISDGESYERYVAECLVKYEGFSKAEVTKASGDFGADVIAWKGVKTYCIQCKNFQNTVTPKAVQEVVTSMPHYRGDKAMVITNSHLSKEALYLAKLHNVEVWEGYGKDDGIEPPRNNHEYVYENRAKYQNNRKSNFINIDDMIEMDEMYDDDDEE